MTDVYGVRGQSEWAWVGDSGAAFRARMTSGGQRADGMLEESERAAQSFDDYAGNLQTAQIQMARARDVALEGGLQVTENEILEPGPAPTAPTALPSDGSATPQMVMAHNEAVQAQQA
ncbi:MAG: WXG100 family type VII secretion target, partial [Actinomycetes bacterium]